MKNSYSVPVTVRIPRTELEALAKIQHELNCDRSKAVRFLIQQALAA